MRLFLSALAIATAASAAPADYSENGANWGEKCTGPELYRQTPVVIPADIYKKLSDTTTADYPVVTLQPAVLNTVAQKGNIRVTITDAGVDVTGDYFTGLEELQLPGVDEKYTLLSMHFHANAEHTYIDAENKEVRDALEAHFVFVDSAGTPRAVLGAMFKESTTPNPYLSLLFPANHPKVYDIVPPKGSIIETLFPDTQKTARSYWVSYPGSLTTPECDETIQWFVTEVDATKAQIDEFKTMVAGAKNDGKGTYRVTQPLYGRKLELVQVVKGAAPLLAAAATATFLTVAALAL